MKTIAAAFLLVAVLIAPSAFAACEGEQAALNSCLSSASGPSFPPPPPPFSCPSVACVPNCTSRADEGGCIAYGADFCGQNPSCTQYCSSRADEGGCIAYGSDICTANPPPGC